ncbi:AMP-dependent synthetase/ligase [Magnetospirillum aberrantis]|uniref:Long-chain fatty acid--CoA ligase n=1 Tax=Magnetospirillum aberrantis SpK TaxID=908842 RepID=A0A7C9UTN7_9PROT|nr:long-chain fatty acid--CoA ligase [Magnetospirillum aberrantis]NFV79706.1 long-chain fatty acid--CoA ligase [Magnetospirillum aberrantis SpK]
MSVDSTVCQNVTDLFLTQAETKGEAPFLWAKHDGAWLPKSWAETRADVLDLAAGLRALGLATGDRVMVVSENRPEWAIADLAVMAAGGITVPAYTTNTPSDHLHILNNSGARFVVTSTRALTEKVMAAAWQADTPPTVIAITPPEVKQSSGGGLISWDDTLRLGRTAPPETQQPVTPARGDAACIIYTSGTGGAPRGVMLSHGALLSNAKGAMRLVDSITDGDDVFLSFLPLSHAYEHTAGLILPILIGAQIYYAESIEALVPNMAEARPTIMTAVPRFYEMMRVRILHNLRRQGALKRKMFEMTVALGTKRYHQGRLGPLESLADMVLERLVRSKVRDRFGGRLVAMVSGGAPLAFDVGVFFTALGVRILQGYGQTEAAPVICANHPRKIKIDTVGPALDGVEVRIAADGEILVRGENVMLGYWNDPASTAAVLRDGWLHTGDIGELDEDGYLKITDRKKDIIVNSGGDNVSPQRVEGFLTLAPEIAQAMAHGDRRPHLVALVVPDAEWAAGWARDNGKPAELTQLVADADFRHAMQQAVDRVNKGLSTIEKVRKVVVAAEGFTTDNGMLTPTMKIRRHIIRKTYGEQLEALYG